MSVVYGIRWDDGRRNRVLAFLLVAAVAAFALVLAMANRSSSGPLTAVVVSEKDGAGNAPEKLVEKLGGQVGQQIGVVNGFVAKVPADKVKDLQAGDGVRFAVVNHEATLASDSDMDGVSNAADSNDNSPASSLALARKVLGVDKLGAKGIDGKGVDVALLDSGIVPAPGLDAANKVVNGPDFSDEGGTDTQFLDTYGHGTHLAGIIAANDPATGFKGMAPGSRLVNLKAASANGGTDLIKLLFAIDFVVQNKNVDGLNIRVLNMSLGADVLNSYISDPLAYAAEQAWAKGVVVVAAVGNGNDLIGIDSPAADPYVIAVGATSLNGTEGRGDDFVPDWSRVSNSTRNPDVVAPGTSLVSLRVPGGSIDEEHPEGRVGDVYFKGSGTSQATAVVSGAAALVIQAHPDYTPDQVKAVLTGSSTKVKGEDKAQGYGQVDIDKAVGAVKPVKVQSFAKADLAKVIPAVLQKFNEPIAAETSAEGEKADLSASRWSASRWSASRWSASRWSASRWSASRWSASRWSASRWSASRWSGSVWE